MTRHSMRSKPNTFVTASCGADSLARLREPFRHCWMGFVDAGDEKANAAQEGEPATEQTDHAGLERPRSPLRVVIVEDEAIISMELEMLLEDLDVDVVGIAMSAADADALVSMHRPDFVTMDISIKGDIDGISAASDIFVRYGVRSIFVSAYGDPETRTRAETANPIGWVRKPIDIAALGEAVRRVKERDT